MGVARHLVGDIVRQCVEKGVFGDGATDQRILRAYNHYQEMCLNCCVLVFLRGPVSYTHLRAHETSAHL
eukprot:9513583-Alexandrium_andersonii.AAC.1